MTNMNTYETYELIIFPNGRVYFLDKEIRDKAIKEGKEILICCNAWSGGYTFVIGAEEDTYDGEKCYNMYQYAVTNEEFSPEDLKKFYKVIFTQGEMIYTQTGEQATSYQGGLFIDWYSSDNAIKEHYELMTYPKKFTGDSSELEKLRKMVDKKRTENHIGCTPNAQKKIDTLKAYGIL